MKLDSVILPVGYFIVFVLASFETIKNVILEYLENVPLLL